MAMSNDYLAREPERAAVDASTGALVLEFGTPWCGFCRQAQHHIARAFADENADVEHWKVEDGPGRPLGRSFKVKLWPTLVFLRDGVEVARVVRPENAARVAEALRQAASPA